jgi:uncharacterized protein (TIGR00290 family)
MKGKVLISWSSGKDSALALYEILKDRQYQVVGLLTTVTEGYDRVSMHGVRRSLLEKQSQSLGLPLEQVLISPQASNQEYQDKMGAAMRKYQRLGVTGVVFGDLFLADVRQYREENLAQVGMRALEPLWGRDTRELAQRVIDLGFKAITTCVDSQALDQSFAGKPLDKQFLDELPDGVDPCGEYGEFHTFVYDGPNFNEAIDVQLGEVIFREDRFYYCDLIE